MGSNPISPAKYVNRMRGQGVVCVQQLDAQTHMINLNKRYHDEICTISDNYFSVFERKPSKFDEFDKEGLSVPQNLPLEFTNADEKRCDAWRAKTPEEIHRIKQRFIRSH